MQFDEKTLAIRHKEDLYMKGTVVSENILWGMYMRQHVQPAEGNQFAELSQGGINGNKNSV